METKVYVFNLSTRRYSPAMVKRVFIGGNKLIKIAQRFKFRNNEYVIVGIDNISYQLNKLGLCIFVSKLIK